MHLSSFLSEGAVSFKDETISTGLSEPQILRPLLDAAKGCADKRKWKTIPFIFWLFEWRNDNECSKGNVELRDFANDEENHNDVYWQTVRQPGVAKAVVSRNRSLGIVIWTKRNKWLCCGTAFGNWWLLIFLAYEVSISTAIINKYKHSR